MIDLGLPSGTTWACCNVGADKPEKAGGQYAWGEIETKDEYTSDNYLYNGINLGNSICGTAYDVAHVKWGGHWQMPTKNQMEELINKCSHEVVEENGVKGIKFTSTNGGSVFFPFNVEDRRGARGYYWSGTADDDGAYGLYLGEDGGLFSSGGVYRDMGRAIRPVDVSSLVPPTLTITPETGKINFGVIMDGTTKTETLSVKNTSQNDVTIYVDADSGFGRYFELADNMEEITLLPGATKKYTITAHGMKAGVSASTNVFVRMVGSDDVTKVNLTSSGNDYSPLVDKTTMTLVVGERGSVRVKASGVSTEEDVEGIVDYVGGGPGLTEIWDDVHDSSVSSYQLGLTFTALKAGVVHITFSDSYTQQTEVLTITVKDK